MYRFIAILSFVLMLTNDLYGQYNRVIVMLKNDSLCELSSANLKNNRLKDVPIGLENIIESIGVIGIEKAMPHRTAKINQHCPPFHRLYVLHLNQNVDINRVISFLNNNENVEYVDRDVEVVFHSDPRYDSGEQWYLQNSVGISSINIDKAWDIFNGKAVV